ncbi:MAG: YvcK family protein [Thermomicrobia bacterium]|nr:YvcK family protein [Thermomicrobia bacterium]
MRKWLRFGMRVKRYLLALALGITLTSLAIAMALATLYRNVAFPGYSTDIVRALTLQFIPHPMREMVVAALGFGVIGGSVYYLSHSLLIPLLAGRTERIGDILYDYRFGKRGPKIVAIGGGTGLPTLLRGLKERTGNLTGIVTMADDGGSTGRLREEFGILPPGDFRNCIAALSDAEPLMQELFQYRFEKDGSGLHGHSFGNLFITAMVDVTGDFEQAVLESSRILAVRGTVFPSTLENVQLHGIAEDGTELRGESEIGRAHGRIRKVFLQPEDPQGYVPAVRAIWDADMIVFGPGSLYTSVIPPLLVGDIKQAIKNNATAIKVYVCNVATQPGETDHFDALAHVRALQEQIGKRVFDYVLVNTNFESKDKIKPEWRVDAVDAERLQQEARLLGVEIIEADVISAASPLRHDPQKLAMALMQLYAARSAGRADRLVAVPDEIVTVSAEAGD